MVIGNQPTAAGLNADLAGLVQEQRSLCERIADFAQQINNLGSAGLQAAPVSMDAASAAQFLTDTGYLSTPALVYLGQATQATNFDFRSALSQAVIGE